MNSQLTHIIAQQRITELERLASAHRFVTDLGSARRRAPRRPVKRIASAFARISTARA